MKKLKTIFSIFMMLVFAIIPVTLTACGSNNESSTFAEATKILNKAYNTAITRKYYTVLVDETTKELASDARHIAQVTNDGKNIKSQVKTFINKDSNGVQNLYAQFKKSTTGFNVAEFNAETKIYNTRVIEDSDYYFKGFGTNDYFSNIDYVSTYNVAKNAINIEKGKYIESNKKLYDYYNVSSLLIKNYSGYKIVSFDFRYYIENQSGTATIREVYNEEYRIFIQDGLIQYVFLDQTVESVNNKGELTGASAGRTVKYTYTYNADEKIDFDTSGFVKGV